MPVKVDLKDVSQKHGLQKACEKIRNKKAENKVYSKEEVQKRIKETVESVHGTVAAAKRRQEADQSSKTGARNSPDARPLVFQPLNSPTIPITPMRQGTPASSGNSATPSRPVTRASIAKQPAKKKKVEKVTKTEEEALLNDDQICGTSPMDDALLDSNSDNDVPLQQRRSGRRTTNDPETDQNSPSGGAGEIRLENDGYQGEDAVFIPEDGLQISIHEEERRVDPRAGAGGSGGRTGGGDGPLRRAAEPGSGQGRSRSKLTIKDLWRRKT